MCRGVFFLPADPALLFSLFNDTFLCSFSRSGLGTTQLFGQKEYEEPFALELQVPFAENNA